MRRVLLILVTMLLSVPVYAQGIRNVRINEILVINERNYEDDYGNRESWIEIHNAGYERVDIGGCYLGARFADGSIKKYVIPRSDARTQMGPQSYIVFFCEGTDTKGTFHTNFTLEGADMIVLYDANGRDVIDEFAFVPSEQQADISIGRITNEEGALVMQKLTSTTPNATNERLADVSRDEIFRRRDPSGVVMTVTAMVVVFLALLLISLIIKMFGKIMVARNTPKEVQIPGVATSASDGKAKGARYNAEEVAAIGMALKLFQEDLHVKESTVITINRVSRMYSPWSSKIHGMRQVPLKKIR